MFYNTPAVGLAPDGGEWKVSPLRGKEISLTYTSYEMCDKRCKHLRHLNQRQVCQAWA